MHSKHRIEKQVNCTLNRQLSAVFQRTAAFVSVRIYRTWCKTDDPRRTLYRQSPSLAGGFAGILRCACSVMASAHPWCPHRLCFLGLLPVVAEGREKQRGRQRGRPCLWAALECHVTLASEICNTCPVALLITCSLRDQKPDGFSKWRDYFGT